MKTGGWTLAPIAVEELLQKLKKSAALQAQSNEKVLETVWSGLVDQLEERSVLTRKELVKAIRKLAR